MRGKPRWYVDKNDTMMIARWESESKINFPFANMLAGECDRAECTLRWSFSTQKQPHALTKALENMRATCALHSYTEFVRCYGEKMKKEKWNHICQHTNLLLGMHVLTVNAILSYDVFAASSLVQSSVCSTQLISLDAKFIHFGFCRSTVKYLRRKLRYFFFGRR